MVAPQSTAGTSTPVRPYDSHRHNDLRGSDTRSTRLHCRTATGGKPVSESHRRDSHALCLLYRRRAAALFSSCPDDRLNGRCEPKLLTGRGGRNPRHGISRRDSCSSRRSWYRGGDNRCCPHQLAHGEQAATDVLIISSLSPLQETRQGPCGPRTIRSFAPASWCQACSVRVRVRTTSTPSLASIRCPASSVPAKNYSPAAWRYGVQILRKALARPCCPRRETGCGRRRRHGKLRRRDRRQKRQADPRACQPRPRQPGRRSMHPSGGSSGRLRRSITYGCPEKMRQTRLANPAPPACARACVSFARSL